MAAKEKGKIVSASPDSPTLEKLSTFSQQIRSALHCFSAVATRANALWQRSIDTDKTCPPFRRNPHECAVAKMLSGSFSPCCRVATRTNALWQRLPSFLPLSFLIRRNPHECAVAKWTVRRIAVVDGVATRTNALWQNQAGKSGGGTCRVATRANALWQRLMYWYSCNRLNRRNPRECAVAKSACGDPRRRRNPRECAVAKMRTQLEPLNTKVATRANALWQSSPGC